MAAVLGFPRPAFLRLPPPCRSRAGTTHPSGPCRARLLTSVQLGRPLQFLQPLHKPVCGGEGGSESRRARGEESARGGPEESQDWQRTGPRKGELAPRPHSGVLCSSPGPPNHRQAGNRQGGPRAAPEVSPHPAGGTSAGQEGGDHFGTAKVTGEKRLGRPRGPTCGWFRKASQRRAQS